VIFERLFALYSVGSRNLSRNCFLSACFQKGDENSKSSERIVGSSLPDVSHNSTVVVKVVTNTPYGSFAGYANNHGHQLFSSNLLEAQIIQLSIEQNANVPIIGKIFILYYCISLP
jgi:hypothetical protein